MWYCVWVLCVFVAASLQLHRATHGASNNSCAFPFGRHTHEGLCVNEVAPPPVVWGGFDSFAPPSPLHLTVILWEGKGGSMSE